MDPVPSSLVYMIVTFVIALGITLAIRNKQEAEKWSVALYVIIRMVLLIGFVGAISNAVLVSASLAPALTLVGSLCSMFVFACMYVILLVVQIDVFIGKAKLFFAIP